MKNDKACFTSCVHCVFSGRTDPALDHGIMPVEVFFASRGDLVLRLLAEYINEEDRQKASRLKTRAGSDILLACYTLLRHVLAASINTAPEDISYCYGADGKPYLKGKPVYFNITHSGNAFAFAISRGAEVGIDLEDPGKRLDFYPVIRRFFNPGESEFIYNDREGAKERFYLLWTRKEALLKAVGSGLTSNLSKLEVHRPVNPVSREVFPESYRMDIHDRYCIFSCRAGHYFLSLATPFDIKPRFHQVNGSNASRYTGYRC